MMHSIVTQVEQMAVRLWMVMGHFEMTVGTGAGGGVVGVVPLSPMIELVGQGSWSPGLV